MKNDSRNSRREDGTKRDGTDGARQSINHTRNARCKLNASQVVFFFLFSVYFLGKREGKGQQKENNRSTRNTGRAYVITSANKNNIENGIV